MSLPLLERAREGDSAFLLTSVLTSPLAEVERNEIPLAAQARIPRRTPQAGEQYRFHFDMTRCIGCKCCVVACNEQNGNPADIHWRRVGEIEGGWYPNTHRLYLSMGCNHCVEPSCLQGCPVDAYKKDAATGIVRHDANACIGCQYCTWNCSYGVPQYNPERGVVGKCDMCYSRLAEGREPACANACPEGAIQIEIVNIAQWKAEYTQSANAPGLPSAEDSISTTRITVPEQLPPDTKKADYWRVRPEHPHWPLVMMTVLTQLSVGAFAAILCLQLSGRPLGLGIAALGSLLLGGLALNAATLHLGRPIHAYRALRMWRRSWLSREVLMFGLFSAMAGGYAGSLWLALPIGALLGGLTLVLGAGGVMASACIYLVRARPAWNSSHTVAEFFLTAALLGPLFVAALGVGAERGLLLAAAIAASAQMLNQLLKFAKLMASDTFELQASGLLLSTVLKGRLLLRGVLLISGGILLPLFLPTPASIGVALAVAVAGEILGRYLFFVSVVPKNVAASYFSASKDAA